MRTILLMPQQRRILRNLRNGLAVDHGFTSPNNFSRSLRALRSQHLINVVSGLTAEYRMTERGREALRTGKYIKREKKPPGHKQRIREYFSARHGQSIYCSDVSRDLNKD